LISPVLTGISGADHGELKAEWEDSEQTWRDGLDIYESVVYTKRLTITADMLIEYDESPTPRP
jgi:hypothetical protein